MKKFTGFTKKSCSKNHGMSRRQFLGRTLAAGTAYAVLPSILSQIVFEKNAYAGGTGIVPTLILTADGGYAAPQQANILTPGGGALPTSVTGSMGVVNNFFSSSAAFFNLGGVNFFSGIANPKFGGKTGAMPAGGVSGLFFGMIDQIPATMATKLSAFSTVYASANDNNGGDLSSPLNALVALGAKAQVPSVMGLSSMLNNANQTTTGSQSGQSLTSALSKPLVAQSAAQIAAAYSFDPNLKFLPTAADTLLGNAMVALSAEQMNNLSLPNQSQVASQTNAVYESNMAALNPSSGLNGQTIAALQPVFGFTAGSTTGINAPTSPEVISATVMNLLAQGLTAAAEVVIPNYDYHNLGEANLTTQDFYLGSLAGKILNAAQALGMPEFVLVIKTDGSVDMNANSATLAQVRAPSGDRTDNMTVAYTFGYFANGNLPTISATAGIKNQIGSAVVTTQGSNSIAGANGSDPLLPAGPGNTSLSSQMGAAAIVTNIANISGATAVSNLSAAIPSTVIASSNLTKYMVWG